MCHESALMTPECHISVSLLPNLASIVLVDQAIHYVGRLLMRVPASAQYPTLPSQSAEPGLQ